MKSEEEIEEIQAIVTLYSIHHADELNPNSDLALVVVENLLCYILDHECETSDDIRTMLQEMRKDLEDNGLNISEAIAFVKQRDAAHKKHIQAKWN